MLKILTGDAPWLFGLRGIVGISVIGERMKCDGNNYLMEKV